MADGISMMITNVLRSMGFDPEKIARDVAQTKDQVEAYAIELRQQLDRIEVKQDAILLRLEQPLRMSEFRDAGSDGLEELILENNPELHVT